MTPAPAALVTGGAAGIGAATVRALIAAGHAVTFCDRDRDAGDLLAVETGATFVHLDVLDETARTGLFAEHGPFLVLVNNVGADQHAFFTDTDPDEWRRLIAINLEATFAFTHGVLRPMQAAHYGRIINVSSEAGRLGSKGGAIYAAAKAGVIGFTRSVARENARYSITCNAVLPGPVRTPMVDAALAAHGDKLERDMASLTLLKRLGRPEEIADAIAFLASPKASFITGEAIGVSGGMGCGAG